MSNNTFFNTFRSNYSGRYFDQNETFQWLTHNKMIWFSWGAIKLRVLRLAEQTTGLIFEVNGRYHHGYVLITLANDDTYTIRYLDFNYNEVLDSSTMVYCDVLQETIDQVIEKKITS